MDPSQIHPVFARQIDAASRGDLDAMLAVYHPEITSLRFQGPVVGRGGAQDLLNQYAGLDVKVIGVEEYVHTDDMIMTRTKMQVKGEEIVAFGAYVIRDGMIWRQFGCDEGGVRNWWA
jgi:hypothetical protein